MREEQHENARVCLSSMKEDPRNHNGNDTAARSGKTEEAWRHLEFATRWAAHGGERRGEIVAGAVWR